MHDINALLENDQLEFEDLKQLEIFGLKTANGDLSFDPDCWELQAIWT
jgi:hypothetical protein